MRGRTDGPKRSQRHIRTTPTPVQTHRQTHHSHAELGEGPPLTPIADGARLKPAPRIGARAGAVRPVDRVASVGQPSYARFQPIDRPQAVPFAVRVQHHVGDVDVPVFGDGEGLAEALHLEVAGVLGHAAAHHPTAGAPRGLHRVGQEVDGVVDGGEQRVDLGGTGGERGGKRGGRGLRFSVPIAFPPTPLALTLWASTQPLHHPPQPPSIPLPHHLRFSVPIAFPPTPLA